MLINCKLFKLNLFTAFCGLFFISLLFFLSVKVYAINVDFGTGSDGACVVNNGTKLLDSDAGNSVCNNSSRTTPYAVNFSSTVLTNSGSSSMVISSTPTGLETGDEVLIINLQGSYTNYSAVGQYETKKISSISGNTLNLTESLINSYDGTTQKIMVQRIPNFSSLIICGGNTGNGCSATATLTASSWNGTKGGVLYFKSTGSVSVNTGGVITMNGKGFAGATTTGSGYSGGAGGSSFCGAGGAGGNESSDGLAGAAGGGGGSGGTTGYGGLGYCGGGGGGGKVSDSNMSDYIHHVGGAGSYAGGAGGGGGAVGAGGGAGYGTIGYGGLGRYQDGTNGSINRSGAGGGAACCGAGGGGGGGGTYGNSQLTLLFFGSGGGRGGQVDYTGPSGNGGSGGGIISITSNTLTNNGSISTNGINGGTNSGNSDSGGGGSGGSLQINANSVTLSSSPTAMAGAGGVGNGYGKSGGNGGNGRVAIYYSSTLTGNSNPTAYTETFVGDITPPSSPDKPTVVETWTQDHYFAGTFTINIPSGSIDTGTGYVSGLSYYSLLRCDDVNLSQNCSIVASGITNSTTSITGSNLPPDGGIRYYYWTATDSAGNVSLPSQAEYIRSTPAPTISSFSPTTAGNDQQHSLTINGTNYSGASVKLTKTGESDINCTSPSVTSNQITCLLNLVSKTTGVWNVVVTNTDGKSITNSNAFTITLPTPIISSISPSNGPMAGGTNITISGLNFYSGGTATGGTISYSDEYAIHTFTSSGTFTPNSSMDVEVLIVAGGGGSGTNGGGGGGAGGVVYNAALGVTAQSYSVTVGNGGQGLVYNSQNGGNSSFAGLTAIGGGGGGSRDSDYNGKNGGSGGGGGGCNSLKGNGTSGQGYNGGIGIEGGSYSSGGGGGGCGASGVNGQSGLAGNGGIGCAYSITGTLQYYAGGGGGGLTGTGTSGTGGLGGGGSSFSSAVANTGGGGGGNMNNGASGIVIIRYKKAINLTIGGNAVVNAQLIDSHTITATTPSHVDGDVDVVIKNPDGQTVTKVGGFKYDPLGHLAKNLPSTILATTTSSWTDNVSSTPLVGIKEIGIKKVDDNKRIATFNANFTQNLNFSGVTADSGLNKAFFHVPTSISTLTNDQSDSYTLYVPKGDGDKVWICPGASSLSAVSLSCSGGYYLSEANPTSHGATVEVSKEGPVGSEVTYWKVSGLTGTGGMSVVTGLKDTLSRLQVETTADHTITFGTNNGLTASGHTLKLEFDPSTKAFNLSTLTISDIKLTDNVGLDRTLASSAGVNTWGVSIDSVNDSITFTAPTSGTGYYPAASQILIDIGTNAGGTHQIANPSSIGSFKEYITITNADTEGGIVDIPIVDSDRVDITGYVSAYMHFDIDTGVGENPGVDPAIDCEFNTCRIYENGQPGLSNYTVDLGELTSAVVNKSSSTSVAHSDGGNGKINSIYFDISTNAPSGAVVTVKSENGGLQGPGTNKIPSIGISTGADGVTRSDGDDIPANSGIYGYTLPVASSQLHGTIVPNSLCDSAVKYCGAGTTPKTVFTTNNLPVDTARVRMDLAAASNYTNNPGLYTDTLTFIAISTF